jgi:hypothetical protein
MRRAVMPTARKVRFIGDDLQVGHQRVDRRCEVASMASRTSAIA